jgi:hypothetical protein
LYCLLNMSASQILHTTPTHPALPETDWQRLVREKVESLRFGVVQLVVHDGRVTQIERTEKTRLAASPTASALS